MTATIVVYYTEAPSTFRLRAGWWNLNTISVYFALIVTVINLPTPASEFCVKTSFVHGAIDTPADSFAPGNSSILTVAPFELTCSSLLASHLRMVYMCGRSA